MKELAKYVVVRENGKELCGCFLYQSYGVYAVSGLHATVACIRDGGEARGKVRAYAIDWEYYGRHYVRLIGQNLVISNGASMSIIEPVSVTEQMGF